MAELAYFRYGEDFAEEVAVGDDSDDAPFEYDPPHGHEGSEAANALAAVSLSSSHGADDSLGRRHTRYEALPAIE